MPQLLESLIVLLEKGGRRVGVRGARYKLHLLTLVTFAKAYLCKKSSDIVTSTLNHKTAVWLHIIKYLNVWLLLVVYILRKRRQNVFFYFNCLQALYIKELNRQIANSKFRVCFFSAYLRKLNAKKIKEFFLHSLSIYYCKFDRHLEHKED